MKNLNVKIEGSEMVIRIPLTKRPSKSGKTLLVASTSGNIKTDAEVDGKPLGFDLLQHYEHRNPKCFPKKWETLGGSWSRLYRRFSFQGHLFLPAAGKDVFFSHTLLHLFRLPNWHPIRHT